MPRAALLRPLVALVAALAAAPVAAQTPAAPIPGAHDVVVDGVRLWYRVAGAGAPGAPPVVFLHGGPGQGSEHFDALVGPHLEPTLRMVYLDQRGSGRSERPWTRAYTVPRLVDDVEGVRRHLGADRIVVVGHSFGAILALEYAAAYPARTAGVVVAAGLWDAPLQCRLRLRTLAERRPDAYARVRADTLNADGTRRSDCELEFRAFDNAERDRYNTEMMFPDPAVEARLDSANAAAGVRNTGELGQALFGSGALLGYRFAAFDRVATPALVVAGAHDGAVRPEALRALADRLPRGRFAVYERAGHFVYLDEPARFARDLTAFVAGLPPARR